MPITREQFALNITRLQVIVMSRLNRPPLYDYRRLNAKEQRVFDKELNDYIQQLPAGKEQDTIESDFNTVCHEEIFHKMKPENMVLDRSTPEEIKQTEPEDIQKLYT